MDKPILLEGEEGPNVSKKRIHESERESPRSSLGLWSV